VALPLVSVIVPNYNYSPSLPLCLRALAEQTYQPLEIVLADDCSTDDSVSVARSFPGVRVIERETNGGCAAARNTAVAHSRGEILFFVDSDVAPAPDAVAAAVELLRSRPGIGAVCGIEDPDPLIRHSRLEEYRALQFHLWSRSAEGEVSFLFPAMCAMERSVFDEVGEFNPRLTQTEEVDYGHRLSAWGPILLTSRVHGRHDHDSELSTLLRKLYVRGRNRVPLYARSRRFARGFETGTRAWGTLAALGAFGTAWLPLALGTPWLAVPVGLAGAAVAADAPMHRAVLARRGAAFGGYFVAVHLLTQATIAAGVASGALRWLFSPRFRDLYEQPAVVA
jgi:glycosyltransferase involved in cell wall biosynthesis